MIDYNKIKDKEITIKQIKSTINSNKRQKATIKGLGLKKIGSTSKLKCTNDIKGMLRKVDHLIEEIL